MTKQPNRTNPVKEFLESLKWIGGKPFCSCCGQQIEACHKCGEKTAFEDILCDDDDDRYDCHESGEGFVVVRRVCRDCFEPILKKDE